MKPNLANWNYTGEEALYQLGTFGISSDLSLVAQNRQQRANHIATLLRLLPQDVVLDLGSGMGFMAQHLAPQVKQLHCADISETYLQSCRERVGNLTNVSLHHIAFADLKTLRRKGITKAYSALLFIHFNTQEALLYLQELHKVLPQGGLLFFDFNDGELFHFDNLQDSFNSHIADYRRRREEWAFGCMQMLSSTTLRNVLAQVGFREVSVHYSRSAFTEMVVERI